MRNVEPLFAFAGMAAVLVVAPGPSILIVVSRAVTLGRRPAVLTALGGAVGLCGQVAVVVLGLGAVIARRPGVLTAITLLGALYLGYLGVQGIRKRKELAASVVADPVRTASQSGRTFRDGLVVGLVNPKRLLIPAVVAPQFALPAGGAPTGHLLLLGAVAVLVAVAVDVCVGVLAAAASGWLSRSVRRLERAGGLAGAVMLGLGAYLAVASQSGS